MAQGKATGGLDLGRKILQSESKSTRASTVEVYRSRKMIKNIFIFRRLLEIMKRATKTWSFGNNGLLFILEAVKFSLRMKRITGYTP